MKALSTERAVSMGYSSDRRKRKRQHRIAARALLRDGGFFNGGYPDLSVFPATEPAHVILA